ncbi:MAG: hypothetical protein RMY16_07475 [Nostoc sp. DedQUE12b]|uniref:hypothetical protein n=1 Tax=Nostoc sp. DedQUE12b TaxID=3075398 RepID=UPI002AD535BE|nr:hypothetical protein [Nostoc sp. DedQUE12b]MDZ8085421.1 hypothetical protein [Nostoc sp. DedQUE12b]
MQRSDIYDDLRQRTDLVERAIAHNKVHCKDSDVYDGLRQRTNKSYENLNF